MSVHGTARWATQREAEQAGLFSQSGALVGWWFESEYDFEPLRYDGDLHQLIIGGTGGGKFTTALAPLLFGSGLDDRAVVVVDPKGEIAQTVGPFFQRAFAQKQNVFVLDPWDEAGTGSTACLNFVSLIGTDNPNYVDDARALADAMILPSGGENQHWDMVARNYLAAVLLYVALDPREKDRRDLVRVREIVTLPLEMPAAYKGKKQETLSEILFGSMDSELADGAIKRGFRALLNREEREQSGVISSVERDTAWIDSPQMKKVLRGPSLDMREAAFGNNKYFVIIPPDFFMTHRYWLRLCITAFAKAFRRYRPNSPRGGVQRWRHIVIDEFANLGEMSFIQSDVGLSRGYEVKYHLVVQDFSQLARAYQQGWESFINSSFQRFFAVSDLFTTEYASRMTGSATVESISHSVSESTGQSWSDNAGHSVSQTSGFGSNQGSRGRSFSKTGGYSETSGTSISQTYSQVQRPLLTPDEVRRLPEGDQLLFIRGMHPIRSWRPPYWEAFPSLPEYSLKEVLGTIGRSPRSEAERVKFMAWRERPLLRQPTTASRVESLPPPRQTSPALAAEKKRYGLKIAIGLGVLALLAYWLWPSSPKPVERVFVPAPAPPPPIPAPPAPQPQPPVRKSLRPPLPSNAIVAETKPNEVTRNYLVQLMRDNVNICPASGSSQPELQLMQNLAGWTIRMQPRAMNSKANFDYLGRYLTLLRKSSWSRRDREEAFDVLLQSLRDGAGYSLLGEIQGTVSRLYANGCPFETVPRDRYEEPRYGGVTEIPR